MICVQKRFIQTACNIYCTVQYTLYAVLCCIFILSSQLWADTARFSETQTLSFFSLACSAADISDDLEVRDAQGNVVRDPSSQQTLENLFISSLIELLYTCDIHTVAEIQRALLAKVPFSDWLITRPIRAIVSVANVIVVTTIKKFTLLIRYCGRLPTPSISILIFPGIILLMRITKLSPVFLRL